jgi:hypothetical protein
MSSKFIIALLSMLLPATCAAQTKPQAEKFVRHLYSRYEHPASPNGPDTMGRGAATIFSFQLLRLIRADEREAHGEVGRLDGDPICDCQDAGGVALKGLDIQLSPHGRAAAHVTLHYPSPEIRKLTLQLLWTQHG